MMLVGYVSDEQYVALADVLLEFERDGQSIAVVRSTPRGAVYAEIEPGRCKVTLVKQGFGSKSVNVVAEPGRPHQFRLLSDRLLGYVWPKWAKAGEQSEFRVHAVEPYRLSLWRYGWKKEFVRLVGWFDEHGPRAVMQITPDGDYTRTGVKWNQQGYGSPHHTQLVAAPEHSGLYYFHAKGESGAFFSFPWVVAPASPQAKMAVLASTNTWNAYNNFGGRSNYINPGGLPASPTVNARQDLSRYATAASLWSIPDKEFKPLSFERPEIGNDIFDNSPWSDSSIEDPIQGRVQCGQAPGEWRLLGWLEREGFAYDFYADAQLHDGTLPLDAYKILIISVHPEYWTREMFRRVQTWIREKGGRLMYLGGNGVNCEVNLEADSTMQCISFDDTGEPQSAHGPRM